MFEDEFNFSDEEFDDKEISEEEFQEINTKIIAIITEHGIHPLHVTMFLNGLVVQAYLIQLLDQMKAKYPKSIDTASDKFEETVRKIRASSEMILTDIELNHGLDDNKMKNAAIMIALTTLSTGMCPLVTGEEAEHIFENLPEGVNLIAGRVFDIRDEGPDIDSDFDTNIDIEALLKDIFDKDKGDD